MKHRIALAVAVASTLLILPLLGGCAGGVGPPPIDLSPVGGGLTFLGLAFVLAAIIGLFKGEK